MTKKIAEIGTVPTKSRRPQPKGGSRKGIPNKMTADLKAMILQALDGAGGVHYLMAQAHKNPGPFLTLVGKVLPMTVSGDPDNPLLASLKVEFIAPKP